MPVAYRVYCLDCGAREVPTRHGTCSRCQGRAVYWVNGERIWRAPRPPEKVPAMCGIDREILREMGIMA